MITIQKYVRAQSLEEAYQLNQNTRNRVIGGMLWVKMGNGSVNTAIDLCDLGLNRIEETETEFSIGASVTLRQIEMHEGLNAYACGAVKRAVKDIVGVQFRNMATVGGSLWGRFGFSDVLTVFLAMDSYVELYKGGVVPLSQFAQMGYERDILVRLIVKKTPCKVVYTSMRNQRTDFPVIACAVSYMNGEYLAVLVCRVSHFPKVLFGHGHRLFANDVFSGIQKSDHDFLVYVVRRRNGHKINVSIVQNAFKGIVGKNACILRSFVGSFRNIENALQFNDVVFTDFVGVPSAHTAVSDNDRFFHNSYLL